MEEPRLVDDPEIALLALLAEAKLDIDVGDIVEVGDGEGRPLLQELVILRDGEFEAPGHPQAPRVGDDPEGAAGYGVAGQALGLRPELDGLAPQGLGGFLEDIECVADELAALGAAALEFQGRGLLEKILLAKFFRGHFCQIRFEITDQRRFGEAGQ